MDRDRDRFIEDSWDDLDDILDGLREGLETDNLQDEYGMDATELIDYVAEEFVLGEEDVERVRDMFENGKCPYCVAENEEKAISGDIDDNRVDPTLGKYVWTDQEDGHKMDAGELVTAYFAAKCENGHDDAYLLYEESWYTEEGDGGE